MEESIQQLLDVLKSVVLFAGPLVVYVMLFKSKRQFRSQEGYYSTPGTVCVCVYVCVCMCVCVFVT
jgi:glycopeptide antibiotics resistance protein